MAKRQKDSKNAVKRKDGLFPHYIIKQTDIIHKLKRTHQVSLMRK